MISTITGNYPRYKPLLGKPPSHLTTFHGRNHDVPPVQRCSQPSVPLPLRWQGSVGDAELTGWVVVQKFTINDEQGFITRVMGNGMPQSVQR